MAFSEDSNILEEECHSFLWVAYLFTTSWTGQWMWYGIWFGVLEGRSLDVTESLWMTGVQNVSIISVAWNCKATSMRKVAS